MYRYLVKMAHRAIDPAFVSLKDCLIEVVFAWTEGEAMNKASLKYDDLYPICAERDEALYLAELARCVAL